MNPSPGWLYRTRVSHRRHAGPAHGFAYSSFGLLLDIDRLAELGERLRLFAHNASAPISFHDRDHGDGRSAPRVWLQRQLDAAGLAFTPARVWLYCRPRVFGYGFNPLSLWFCEDHEGRVRALLCEVHNTFGERHSYLLHDDGRALADPVTMRRHKVFHVSPFFPVDGEYRFRIAIPDARLAVGVALRREGRAALSASERGTRRPLSDAVLLREVLIAPWATLKIIVLIHWQALRLWLRGAPFHVKPRPPRAETSFERPEEVR